MGMGMGVIAAGVCGCMSCLQLLFDVEVLRCWAPSSNSLRPAPSNTQVNMPHTLMAMADKPDTAATTPIIFVVFLCTTD